MQAAGVWRPAALNEQLCPGDVIHVGERSRAEVTVVNQPNVRLDQNTALHLPGDDQPLVVKLLYGAAYFFSRIRAYSRSKRHSSTRRWRAPSSWSRSRRSGR